MIRLKKNVDNKLVFNDLMNSLNNNEDVKNKIYDLSYEFTQIENYKEPDTKLVISEYYNKFIKFCNEYPNTIIDIILEDIHDINNDFIDLNNEIKLEKINELLNNNSNIIKNSIKDYFFK